MYCLRSELVADQRFDLPPTFENLVFLAIGMVLLFSLVLAICMFEQSGYPMGFATASAVCGGALSIFIIMRWKTSVVLRALTALGVLLASNFYLVNLSFLLPSA